MAPKAKIAVTLPQEVSKAAPADVDAGRELTRSAYVSPAGAERVAADGLGDLLRELLTGTGGPLTDAERLHIDRVAGWSPGLTPDAGILVAVEGADCRAVSRFPDDLVRPDRRPASS